MVVLRITHVVPMLEPPAIRMYSAWVAPSQIGWGLFESMTQTSEDRNAYFNERSAKVCRGSGDARCGGARGIGVVAERAGRRPQHATSRPVTDHL